LAALADLASTSILSRVNQPQNEAFRLLALALSSCAILYGEYRLTVNGIIFSISAAICAGISKALHRIHSEKFSRPISTLRDNTFYACALIVTTTWILFEERTWSVILDLRIDLALMLALNTVSSAVVIVLGRSWMLPLYPYRREGPLDSKNIPVLGDIATYLSLAGLIGYSSVVMLRRSYTSPLQLIGYFAAILCLDNGRLFGLPRWYQSRSRGNYSLIGNSRGAEIDDNFEPNCNVNERSSSCQAWDIVHRLLNNTFSMYPIVRVFLILGLWTAFLIKNFANPSTTAPGMPTSLDLAYTPHADTEIVISMYREPLDFVNYLIASLKAIPSLSSAIIHIYTKDEDANLDAIQRQTGADNVTHLANVGREGETYLHHIVYNWNSLAGHTLFVQGDVHNPREFFPRVRDYYDPEKTGMLSFGFSGNVCNCQSCGDRWGWSDSMVYKIYEEIYPTGLCSKVLLSYKGQFIVSARRIRGVSKTVYEQLLNALMMETSWAHQEEYLKGRKDSLNAPFFGFTLERLWNVLLQCSDLDVAWRCPTLLSGTRSGGDKGDCQCFDDVGK